MTRAPSRSICMTGLEGVPLVEPGDDLAAIIASALDGTGIVPGDGDVLVVAQKIVSKAENRYRDLSDVIRVRTRQRFSQNRP